MRHHHFCKARARCLPRFMNASSRYFQASNARALDAIETMLHEDATYDAVLRYDELNVKQWTLVASSTVPC
jgi:hypothetical protein